MFGGQLPSVPSCCPCHGLQEIQSSSRAFAALRADARVITWGHPECGGNSSNLEGVDIQWDLYISWDD